MAKSKEIKLDYVKSANGATGAVAYFIKNDKSARYQISYYCSPDTKVLKAKSELKAIFPDLIKDWLSEHEGWIQVEKSIYDTAKNCGINC